MGHWVVDAINVIGSRPTGWWRDRPGAVRRLAADLQRFHLAVGEPVTLVVDGRPLPDLPEGDNDGVQVCYARRAGPDAADDRIVELLASGAVAVPALVVTSDRRLRQRVTALGADVTGAGELLARLDQLDGRNPSEDTIGEA